MSEDNDAFIFRVEEYYFLSLLFILSANGFLPGGTGTTIRHDTQHTSHNITDHNKKSKKPA
jgi:hypothetical protein